MPFQRILRPRVLNLEDMVKLHQQTITSYDLHSDIPEDTRNSFERLRTLCTYGIFYYDAFTIAYDLCWLVMEQAFRERFIIYFDRKIPFVNTQSGEEDTLSVQNFEEVYAAFHQERKYCGKGWRLKIKTTGKTMVFRATFSDLLKWARSEGLLCGQKNFGIEEVYRESRNSAAHPEYHEKSPSASIHAISTLAEIINRLWGYDTPGGRLYPAPLDREVLVLAWMDKKAEYNTPIVIKGNVLATFDPPGNWQCLIVLAVYGSEGVSEFDVNYERTRFPTELLWGPGSTREALEWLKINQPKPDTISSLDRLVVLRIHEGRVSLPMRPEIALARLADRREGKWFIIKADDPNNALVHVRHINNGSDCSDSKSIPSCPVGSVFDGTWNEMASHLANEFRITKPATITNAEIPSCFRFNVAPDVEDD